MYSSLHPSGALDVMENLIDRSFKLPVVTAGELSEMLEKGEQPVLFDTRTKEEYDKSHIENALRVDPHTSSEDFLSRHTQQIRGKTVVFYCSVGQRSSDFLNRVHQACKDAGAIDCYNLRGGIFRWYNEGYPVVNDKGETDDIHRYNSLWGMMIEKRKT